jgi:hypothetical protein
MPWEIETTDVLFLYETILDVALTSVQLVKQISGLILDLTLLFFSPHSIRNSNLYFSLVLVQEILISSPQVSFQNLACIMALSRNFILIPI